MPFRPNDEQLTRLAANAGRMIFSPSTEAQSNRCANESTCFAWCYWKKPTWVVKFSIHGKVFRIGKFPARSKVDATRFADMAIIRFWKYQNRREGSVPSDRNTTHGVEAATRDLKVNVGPMILLEEIEKRLHAIGAFGLTQPTTTTENKTT